MDPVTPWIAALAERSLSFYLGRRDDGIQAEDIEGCLNFSFCDIPEKTAIVVTWGQGDTSRHATLTDSQNQVDAVITRDSPNIPGAASPCPPSTKGGPRHLVELSDIKLVFIYSASPPEVELRIGRFHIRPNAVPKADAPKPKLRKVSKLKPLMNQAQRKAQQSQEGPNSHSRSGNILHDTPSSRHDQSLLSQQLPNSATQVFNSQATSHNLPAAPKEKTNKSRVSLGGSTELLAFYANPQSIQSNSNKNTIPGAGDRRRSPADSETAEVHSDHGIGRLSKTTGSTSVTKTKVNPRSTTLSMNKDARSLREGHANHAEHSAINSVDTGPTATTERGDEQRNSKKRHRDSAGAQSHVTKDQDLRLDDSRHMRPPSPSKKRRRTNAEEATVVDSTGVERSPTEHVLSVSNAPGIGNTSVTAGISAINHWEGMTAIPSSEVEIPKNQLELLEQLKWYPQKPGVSAPLCHVPPHLLSQWNDMARRRDRRAKQLENQSDEIPDRAPTPTPRGTNPSTVDSASESEELSWASSSREGSPRNALPEDTPPRQIMAGNEKPALTATQDSARQFKPNDDVDLKSGTQDSLPDACSVVVGSADAVDPAAKVHSPPRDTAPTIPTKTSFPRRAAGSVSYPRVEVVVPHIEGPDNQPSTPIRQSPRRQSNLGNAIIAPGSQERLKGEESDDSDDGMEASVPFALGQSVPMSSQPQHDPTSSGPSLPGIPEGNIQVAETPVVGTLHLQSKRDQQASLDSPGSQKLLSEDHKISSSSRIRNTYCSQESHRQIDSSQEATHPSLLGDDTNLPREGGFGSQTQASGSHALSQATQSPSNGLVDSSELTRRQRGSSIFHLEPSGDPSSLPHASAPPPAMSRPNKAAKESEMSPPNLRRASKTLQSLAKAPPAVSRGGKAHTHSPDVEIATRRQSYLGQADKSAEAQRIFESFCSAYPLYSGDFSHFVNMCSTLHAMREKGLLKRSFLWDDFVIINLENPENLDSRPPHAMSYEAYFCENHSIPQYKKRNLTARGIDVAASQRVTNPIASPEGLPSPSQLTNKLQGKQNQSVEGEAVNVSFTASLVDKFSGLHAQSFGNAHTDRVPSPVLQPAAIQSSSTSSDDTESEPPSIKEENDDDSDADFPTELSASHTSHPNMDGEVADSTQASTDSALSASPQNAPDKTESDVGDLDDTQEADDTHHRTASIELGDDTNDCNIPVSSDIVPVATSKNDSHAESPKRKRKRNTWFSSLQNLFSPKNTSPANPPWSHDPNTPFKRWARQDQNVLQEINRRGGTKVLLDERGVICRPTYNRAPMDSQ
ncbi:hypothetical protein N7452_004465 [Penicillium brevicompactum]|uniref:Telomere replication protein EST3 n=1 Tax=Penicillium brevicompactum TaxID=5074 RepID=A0A9W9QGT8_PENBR|nr:hypothetical protein N7452_004465 [Penicillium brevicompactum]